MTDIEHIKQLALALESPDRASSALATLHEVAKHLENGSCQDKKAHPLTKILKLKVVQIPGRAEPLKLLLHKAVFSPEEWAKTFAEGLLKTPELFQGKSLVELGTGSGWISLLLLAKTSAHDILGLDINPYAVYIARLNAWLNGTDEEGAAVKSVAGVPIFKAFKVRESDLLSEPLKRNAKFDHIIGCIPQVLHPDQSKLPSRPDDFSERELYDLSNYCFQQGILEDRFGLPLIARALEEAQLCLRPHGKVTLVLGGRPGPQAIDAMFRRRGWEPTLIWSRRIQQADDTDLCSLVEIERRHQIRFHFFLSRDSEQSLSAETAVRVLSEGKPVYHDLLVYQATTRSETATLGFVHNLHKLGLDGMRKELDFSRVSEELISFLNRFSSELIASRTIAYPHERGDIGMREALAKFLRTYCYYPITAAELFLAPERPALLDMVLKLVLNPGDRVLLSRSLEDVYRPVLHECGLEVILGNDDLAELIELDDMLAPKASIIAPQQLAQPSPLNLSHISGQAEKHPDRWYVVDDSAQFMITSQLGANMTLRLAGQRELPANLVFLYGLVKSSVCSDFEMSFLINAPQSWLQYFDVGAELTYSRMPFQVQLYYQWLFEELLAFPFQDPALSMEARRNEAVKPITKSFNSIAADPVFAPKPVEPGAVPLKPANQAVAACGGVKAESEIIRLDYGEVEAPVPELLIRSVFKGFFEQAADVLPQMMRQRVEAYLRSTRGVNVSWPRIVLGQGVFPLLSALMRQLRERLGRAPVVGIPRGSYGPLFPMIEFHGGIPEIIETDPSHGFLFHAGALKEMKEKPDMLWLTQPNNPSGLFFDSATVKGILETCAERRIYVMADEVFFLLSDHRLGEWTPPYLSFLSHAGGDLCRYLFVADGISKAFAAGGLRCGFMVTPDADWASQIQGGVSMPARSTLRAWDSLYSAFLEESPHLLLDVEKECVNLRDYLVELRKTLSDRRARLRTLLAENGRDDAMDTPYRGGIFVLSRTADLYAKLAKEEALLINSPDWSRTPGWCRMCFSMPDEKFETALSRLRKVLSSL